MGLLKCCLEWGQQGPGGTERPGGSQDPVVRGGTQNTSSLWVLLTSRPGWVGTLWAECAAGWGCGKDCPAGRTGVTGAVDRGAVWTREFWERCKYRLLEHRDPKVGLWLCVAAEGKGRGRGRGGQEGRGVIGGRTGQGVAGAWQAWQGRQGPVWGGEAGWSRRPPIQQVPGPPPSLVTAATDVSDIALCRLGPPYAPLV